MKLFSNIKPHIARVKSAVRANAGGRRLLSAASSLSSPFCGKNANEEVCSSGMFLPMLTVCGLIAGLCLCLAVSGALMRLSLSADIETARSAGTRAPSFANAKSAGGLSDFTSVNPFGADRPKQEEAPTAAAAIDSLTLQGTLPNVGAWITGADGATSLVLKGQEIGGYKLVEIKYGEAVLALGEKRQSIYLFLSGSSPAPFSAPASSAPSGGAKPKLDFSGVVAADDGKEGAVPRELVDALLMNPYDELGKMRMTPAEDGSGMKLERIAPDSVFARVGVAQGDVIQAINGVNISNMADAANAVNSLMAGTRFDVKVKRGDKPLELKYQVK